MVLPMACGSLLIHVMFSVVAIHCPDSCRKIVATLPSCPSTVGGCRIRILCSCSTGLAASMLEARSAYLLRKWGFSLSLTAGPVVSSALNSAGKILSVPSDEMQLGNGTL